MLCGTAQSLAAAERRFRPALASSATQACASHPRGAQARSSGYS